MDQIEKNMWSKVEKYQFIFEMTPYLKMASVCNNLAFGRANEDSDIDIFAILDSRRFFTARFFLTLLTSIFKVRRHADLIKGRFCLSFFVDEKHLALEKIAISDDIYLAYWLRKMVLIVDDGVSKEFLNSNKWILKFCPDDVQGFKVLASSGRSFARPFKRFFEIILSGYFGDLLESVLGRWQLRRASKKAAKLDEGASVFIEKGFLKFHNIDRRRHFLNKWKSLYDDFIVTDEKFSRL